MIAYETDDAVISISQADGVLWYCIVCLWGVCISHVHTLFIEHLP